MKYLKIILEKYQKKELTKYLFWKLGLQKLFRKQFFTNPIRYFKFLYYKNKLSNIEGYGEDYLNNKFKLLRNKKSDIFLHLDTLYEYSRESSSIFETGVRGVVSSWAFLKALNDAGIENNKLLLNDIDECDVSDLKKVAQNINIDLSYIWQDNLSLNLDTTFDIIFIDTLHVYGQLIRELNKFSKICNKYLIMHDTTVDGIQGEILRRNLNINDYSLQLGIPVEELNRGLWPAVEEFLNNRKIKTEKSWGVGRMLLEIFEETVESNLIDPTFVTEYPVEVSPLSRRNEENPEFADRFELFIGGKEFANGFCELNDPDDQASRFEDQVAAKDSGDKEAMDYDHDYITALEHGMPPAVGVGMGVDRLVMLLTNQSSIRDVLLFPQLKSSE